MGIVIDEELNSGELEGLSQEDLRRPILANLRDVTMLNSCGIGFLLKMNRQVQTHGGTLVIHSLPAYVRQVINFMKLDQVLRIAGTEAEAREMLT